MNVQEIDAASNNGVDNIRDIKEQVQYPPTAGKYRVFIIDEVQDVYKRQVLLRDVGSMAYRRYRRPLTMKEREVCIQIWFKTYACLKYLEEQGRLREELRDGASYWIAVS